MRRTWLLAALVVTLWTLTQAVPLKADIITVETAYLFTLPHGGGGPDGGSVRITNMSAVPIGITSVFISGWVGGTTFEWAGTGPAVLGPGVSGEYNQAFPPYAGDTSNFGLLTNPQDGVHITIAGTIFSSDGVPFSRQYIDNITFAITGCVNTGADVECDGVGSPNNANVYGRVTLIPEPATLLLLGTGLLGLGAKLRKRFT